MFVTIEGKNYKCDRNEKLIDVLRRNGFFVNSPCGGTGKCGKCKVMVDGVTTLACQYLIEKDISAEINKDGEISVLSEGANERDARINPICDEFIAAVDIGTTTIACTMVNGNSGEIVASCGLSNPQKIYGADVVTRLRFARDGKRIELTGIIQDAVGALIKKCCSDVVSNENIRIISIAANPCMQQLFFNKEIDNLITIPYKPIFTSCEIYEAKNFLPNFANAKIICLPNISAYVGSDTICAVLASNILNDNSTSLLVDIGTNGEIFLKHNGEYYSCSTAAGPALEGNGIEFGMSACSGAIDKVYIDEGCLITHTIDESKAVGICGSGLVDAVACLIKLESINKRGKICSNQKKIMLTSDVYLSQNDIRQFQLAKGAIATGIDLICREAGINIDNVKKLYLAGAFGNYVNPKNALITGLLPSCLNCEIIQIGNAALVGAKLLALDKDMYLVSKEITKKTKPVELSSLKEFSLTFAKNTEFILN